MITYRTTKTVQLVEHNSDVQINFGGHGFSDTRTDLKVGKWYDVQVEVHGWHTRYYIGETYYNSACFKDITAKELNKGNDK